MKKIIALIIVLFTITTAQACDICGCGAGGSFMGIIPQFGKSQFGMRGGYRLFHHPNTDLNVNGTSRVLQDENYSSDFFYRKFKGKHWQFVFTVPFKSNTRIETERTTTIQGIGDIQFATNYTLLNTSDSMDYRIKQILVGGVGVKLPTGKYMQRDETKAMLPALFQIGTGAYNYFAQAYYVARHKRWGLNVIAQYTIMGMNELDYDYGDQFQTTISLFYKRDFTRKVHSPSDPAYIEKTKTTSILPTIGYTIENSKQDFQYEIVKENTGGTQYLIHGGVDIYFTKISISLYHQYAFFNDIPQAQPENKQRWGVAVGYSW
jgi:hypothetical protein